MPPFRVYLKDAGIGWEEFLEGVGREIGEGLGVGRLWVQGEGGDVVGRVLGRLERERMPVVNF